MSNTILIILLVITCITIIVLYILNKKMHDDFDTIKNKFADIRKEVDEYAKIEEEYNNLVDKHNNLVNEHNRLVSEYEKIIKTHNNLIKDFNKSKGYNGYLADINEYLLGLQTFNTKSAQKFEDFCQEAADKYKVENIIKKEVKENE